MNQRTNKITIIGAGMAGLLAGNMLRRHDVTLLERNESLPDNHSALLRFRTTAVSDATGIPFERISVDKGVWDGDRVLSEISLAHANAYSLIVTGGELHARSIKNLDPDERFLAPWDFVEQMAKNLNIQFGQDVARPRQDHPVISTIPMPVMMKAVGWEEIPDFGFKPIWTLRTEFSAPVSHVHQTLYSIVGGQSWYRATIHRDKLILEFAEDPCLQGAQEYDMAVNALKCFFGNQRCKIGISGPIEVRKQQFGKIVPIDEEMRRKFILHLTDKWNIYSLGRFATWRTILLDNLVRDIKHIESMIASGCNYSRRLNTY